MKKVSLSLISAIFLLLPSVTVWGQGIKVHLKDGRVLTYKASEVVKVTTFNAETTPQEDIMDRTIMVGDVEFKMIYVKGGTFRMGATEGQGTGAYDNEYPVHIVDLDDYYIGETEVTQELWQTVMDGEMNPSWYEQAPTKPVQNLSRADCLVFISRLNKLTGLTFVLPTEAQWEYAARGGKYNQDKMFAGSDNIDEVGWYAFNSDSEVHEVAQKLPNELGLYDMTGNVWEWCSDYFSEDYYSQSPKENPTGPVSGERFVFRGGSIYTNERNSRVAVRNHHRNDHNYGDIGLRLVLKVE